MASSRLIDYLTYGLAAARPVSPDVPAGLLALYLTTDTHIPYAWDGSAWVDISTAVGAYANLRLSANISGGSASPSATTLTAFLDAVLGTTRGAVIARGASTWSLLAPGTAGQVLKTGGAGADAAWGDIHNTPGTVNATATGTITPTNLESVVVNVGTVNTTLTVGPGVLHQRLLLEIKQGATAHTVSFDSSVSATADVPIFTAGTVAAHSDWLLLIANTGSTWVYGAINHN